MTEDRTNKMLDRIEKLIVDGNREILEKLGGRMDGIEGRKRIEAKLDEHMRLPAHV